MSEPLCPECKHMLTDHRDYRRNRKNRKAKEILPPSCDKCEGCHYDWLTHPMAFAIFDRKDVLKQRRELGVDA